MSKTPWKLLWLAMLVCVPCRAEDETASRLKFGKTPAAITFTDTHYLPRTLADFGKKRAYVIVFTTLDCPVVRRSLPALKGLAEAYRPHDVQFLALNVGADDPLVEIANQALQAELGFPVGKDFDGVAAQALGVSRTPEAVVLDSELRLCYRGRISSQVRRGGVSPAPPKEELREALEDLLASRDVAVRETPVDGCLIEFGALRAFPARVPDEVTFSEHVAPLLARHCQDCHRPGTAAPFSLLTYEDAASHAETIADVVRSGQMPPAFASREYGHFENLRTLSKEDRALILAWVRQGKRPGDAAKEPAPREFPAGKWQIGEPDLVLSTLLESEIPATGIVPYQYAVLPKVFLHDTWVQRVEVLPGNRAVVHHCNLGYVKLGEKPSTKNLVSGYVPGGGPLTLDRGVGLCIPAGSVLALQIHYVTTGQPEKDRTSVGIVFAQEKIERRLQHLPCIEHNISIPPGEGNHRLETTQMFPCSATGIGLYSHMHLRGKDMVFRAAYPDGTEETLLAIPNYDFNWQMAYRWRDGAMKFPQGTRLTVRAHYDNSAFNPFNPDATATVTEGQQSFDEMMYGFLFYTNDDEQLNLDIDPKTGRVLPAKSR